jgi:hypothetical protein
MSSSFDAFGEFRLPFASLIALLLIPVAGLSHAQQGGASSPRPS